MSFKFMSLKLLFKESRLDLNNAIQRMSCNLAVVVDLHSASELPIVQGRKWIKKCPCLSVASCGHFPFCDLHNRAPEGQRSAVAFFGIPFLAKQERYVAAGLPPAGNLKMTIECHFQIAYEYAPLFALGAIASR